MITIIHGDDISESRNYFLQLKQKQKNIVLLVGGKITITDLVQNVEGSSLFGNANTIFIEDLLTKLKKTEKTAEEILNFIIENSKKFTFVLWESKEISKRDLGLFKDAIVKIFKLPKNIFLFLDNLKPGNSKNLVNLLHQALDSGIKEELILFMIQRQVRLLLALSDNTSEKTIDEVICLAPWQKEKLVRQGRFFSQDQLKRIYNSIYKIELGLKTGRLNLTLSQAIDFLLFEI